MMFFDKQEVWSFDFNVFYIYARRNKNPLGYAVGPAR
jgi:hypothetical protein